MKRLTIIAFAVAAVFTVFCASALAQKTTGGIKGGLNLARFTGNDAADELDFKMGFCAGGFITYNIGSAFAIQPEVLFTMKGAQSESIAGFLDETMKISMELDYLEIPLLFKLSVPTQGGIKPWLFAGPAVAINLSAKSKVEYGVVSEDADMENIKETDLGLVVGGGFDLGTLVIEARYTLGLTSIEDFEIGETDLKNAVVSIMAGISF